MATQTSLMAQQIRIQQWAEQIRECQNRPKGMDVETWCAHVYSGSSEPSARRFRAGLTEPPLRKMSHPSKSIL